MMNVWGTDICQTCLSNDRTLHPLYKLQPILKELHFLQVINIIGGICWECQRIMMRMHKFKNQVLEAQHILYHNLELKYIGSLSIEKKNDFDYKINHNIEQHVNSFYIEANETKNLLSSIKEEVRDEKLDLEDGTFQGRLSNKKFGRLLNKCISKEYSTHLVKDEKQMKNSKKVLRAMKNKLKKTGPTEKEEEDLSDKFTTVIFTEEEMIRNREEKRRQPNFMKIPYKCDSCVLGFTRKETFDLHYEKKHDESIGPHSCPVCSTRFANRRAMEAHRRRHYSCLRCRLCKYETLQRGSAVAHCGAKHAADRRGSIHCGQCGFVAGTAEDLAEHKRTQHSLYCNVCGEKFKGQHTLRTHKIRIHTSNRDFICDICNKTFKTKSRLESHMATHNATLAQKLAYCNVCKVQYKNIYVYRNHLKNSANHSERLYHCQDCNKRFASKVYWQKHCDFYHLKKSRFKCELCNKLLISDWRLKNHMQTRHGSTRTRNHACSLCAKKFYTLSTLRAHRLTHSPQRTYMCEQCGDTFKQRAALHTHARTHARVAAAHMTPALGALQDMYNC